MADTAEKWLRDDAGNRASVVYFGSEEVAREALQSLKGCRNCVNCSNCWRCSYCSNCWRCSGCWDCADCSDCSGCRNCQLCSYRSDCWGRHGETGHFERPATPKIEHIHARVLEAASRPGALDMTDWHPCETTHCRAGWVVHLAGEPGYALERFCGPVLAAQLIYRESSPKLTVSPARFYETNDEAMADMHRMAELEAAEERSWA
jgi:hypothetical protein